MTQAFVVGHPVTHSLSPALHRAAYAIMGLDWTFQAVDVPEGALAAFVAGRDAEWRGLAITMPHKIAVVKLGRPDAAVRRLGVGNTLLFGPEGATVHNTDVSGFLQALAYRRVDDASDALLLGAGATARAALMALNNLGVLRVTAQVRDQARAADWLGLADDLGLEASVEPLGTPHETDLLISTLPAGAADAHTALVDHAGAVMDVCYDPWPTKLTQAGAAVGLPVVTGLDLLAGQAIQQIDLMAGDTVGIDVLIDAGMTELARRATQPMA